MTLTSRDIAEPNTFLRCEVGSTVHGISVGGDDRDEMGICFPYAPYVIGLRHFEQWVYRTQPQGVRSGPGDLDLTIYSARKWCSLALKGNPSVLLPLFVPEDRCVIVDEFARSLRSMAWAFASKKAGQAFLGYMQAQRQRLMGERGQMNVKRPELIEQYGFDTKYAAHIIRLAIQGIEYMDTGRLTIPMLEENASFIREVRRGCFEENEVLTFIGELDEGLKLAVEHTSLPDEPDYDVVNNWLVWAHRTWWDPRERRDFNSQVC